MCHFDLVLQLKFVTNYYNWFRENSSQFWSLRIIYLKSKNSEIKFISKNIIKLFDQLRQNLWNKYNTINFINERVFEIGGKFIKLRRSHIDFELFEFFVESLCPCVKSKFVVSFKWTCILICDGINFNFSLQL